MSWAPPLPSPRLASHREMLSAPDVALVMARGHASGALQLPPTAWAPTGRGLGLRVSVASSHVDSTTITPPVTPSMASNSAQSPTSFASFGGKIERRNLASFGGKLEGRNHSASPSALHLQGLATSGQPGSPQGRHCQFSVTPPVRAASGYPSTETSPQWSRVPSLDPVRVVLNVYYQRSVSFDDNGRAVRRFGQDFSWGKKFLKDVLGVYHVGVQVHQAEYAFGNYHAPNSRRIGAERSGVFSHEPRLPGPAFVFKESVELGTTLMTPRQVEDLCAKLGLEQYSEDSYNRIHHNCVDFARSLTSRLGAGEVPLWCYRGAAAARLLGLGGNPPAHPPREEAAAGGPQGPQEESLHVPAEAAEEFACLAFKKKARSLDDSLLRAPSTEHLFHIGEPVYYLCRTSGKWIPSVGGYSKEPLSPGGPAAKRWSSRLDGQPQAPPSQVRPREEPPGCPQGRAAPACPAALGGRQDEAHRAGARRSPCAATGPGDVPWLSVRGGEGCAARPLEPGTPLSYLPRGSGKPIAGVVRGISALPLPMQAIVRPPSPIQGDRQAIQPAAGSSPASAALRTASPSMQVAPPASPTMRVASPAMRAAAPALQEQSAFQNKFLAGVQTRETASPVQSVPYGGTLVASLVVSSVLGLDLSHLDSSSGIGRPMQRGFGPEMWGITVDQLKDIMRDPRYKARMTTRQVVEAIIKPSTAGTGMGYAVLRNFARPLQASVMICHAWDDDFGHLVNALEASDERGPFWVSATAMYQSDDMPQLTLATQLGVEAGGPIPLILGQATSLICIPSVACNIYARLWCLFEVFMALQLGLEVQTAKAHAAAPAAAEGTEDPLCRLCLEPVSSKEARCGASGATAGADELAIRRAIESSPGGYAAIDSAVEELRLAALLRAREELLRSGRKEPAQHASAIEAVGARLGAARQDAPSPQHHAGAQQSWTATPSSPPHRWSGAGSMGSTRTNLQGAHSPRLWLRPLPVRMQSQSTGISIAHVQVAPVPRVGSSAFVSAVRQYSQPSRKSSPSTMAL